MMSEVTQQCGFGECYCLCCLGRRVFGKRACNQSF